MTDQEWFSVETSSGSRPPTALGERVIIALALVALVGGVAVGIGNVVRGDSETADASASGSPSGTPRPTPIPLRVVALDPGYPPEYPVQPAQWSGWIRAIGEVQILLSPEIGAPSIGVLAEGDYASGYEEDPSAKPGWLHIDTPRDGWILGGDSVYRYEAPIAESSGYVNNLLAGADGFLALGRMPGRNDYWTPDIPIVSGDGANWRAASEKPFGGWEAWQVAWGPAGWLAASSSGYNGPGQVWIWRSDNGVTWETLGSLGGNAEYPTRLVASGTRYLLQTSGGSRGSTDTWYSEDGHTWREIATPALLSSQNRWQEVVAIAHGFYAWGGTYTGYGYGQTTNPAAAFSPDGKSWLMVDEGPQGQGMRMTGVNGGFLAIDADPETGAPRAWVGGLRRDGVTWRREPEEDAALAGAVVTAMGWDGARAYAFGWERATEDPLMWTADGTSWTRSRLPPTYGGILQSAVAGPAGVVALGHRQTLSGDNPIFWHLTPNGDWVPEAQPIMPVVPDPTTADCPAMPTDLPAFMVLDRTAALVCFGGSPFSLRGYSVSCEGCYDSSVQHSTPTWLAAPTENQLYLAPIVTADDGGWWTSMVVHPSLVLDPAWAHSWLELTGHFDDPEAATCSHQPSIEELQWWSGQQWFVDNCRQTFVVTAVTRVDGP